MGIVKNRMIHVQQKLFRTHLCIIKCHRTQEASLEINFCMLWRFCKSYDSVKNDLLWKKLQKLGMPTQILELLKFIYEKKLAV